MIPGRPRKSERMSWSVTWPSSTGSLGTGTIRHSQVWLPFETALIGDAGIRASGRITLTHSLPTRPPAPCRSPTSRAGTRLSWRRPGKGSNMRCDVSRFFASSWPAGCGAARRRALDVGQQRAGWAVQPAGRVVTPNSSAKPPRDLPARRAVDGRRVQVRTCQVRSVQASDTGPGHVCVELCNRGRSSVVLADADDLGAQVPALRPRSRPARATARPACSRRACGPPRPPGPGVWVSAVRRKGCPTRVNCEKR